MGVSFPGKKRYKGVRFNVISVTKGWVVVKFSGKKRYLTLEWPHADRSGNHSNPNKFDPPHLRGVSDGVLGGQKFKSAGNVMNCRENQFIL